MKNLGKHRYQKINMVFDLNTKVSEGCNQKLAEVQEETNRNWQWKVALQHNHTMFTTDKRYSQ